MSPPRISPDRMIGDGGAGRRDRRPHPAVVAVHGTVAAFGTYACMYGFRKPFTAGLYAEDPFTPGMKATLVAAQLVGYTASKLIGIRVIAEMPARRRIGTLLGLIAVAEAAWIFFAILPPSFGAPCLFLNGLPLGMVFGLVLGFLEGRRLSEAFIAALCCSFIVADGISKTVGLQLLAAGVPERWMPAAAGAVFAIPLVFFARMLGQVAPPSDDDVEARAAREPLDHNARIGFLRRNGWVVGAICLAYLLVTVLRSLRADFARELWTALGATGEAGVFTRSELWVALTVLVPMVVLARVGDNRRAFRAGLALSCLGLAAVAAACLAWPRGGLDPFAFMVLVGTGLYLPYVAVHATVFERLIALTRDRANLGFLMYLADSAGYLGVCGVMLARRASLTGDAVLPLFLDAGIWVAVAGIAALVFAGIASRPAAVRPG